MVAIPEAKSISSGCQARVPRVTSPQTMPTTRPSSHTGASSVAAMPSGRRYTGPSDRVAGWLAASSAATISFATIALKYAGWSAASSVSAAGAGSTAPSARCTISQRTAAPSASIRQ